MKAKRILTLCALGGAPAALPACDGQAPAGPDLDVPALAGQVASTELPDPDDFVATIANPYYPLIPGTVFTYQAETEEGLEVGTVEVTVETKVILGITATVVHDRVFLEGVLTEETYDWYAQDSDGNVWYLGEDSCEIEDDECVSREGSWEAGVDGAEAGVIMWADPSAHVGETYRQEFLEGEAEDVAKVLRLTASVEVPYGSFSGCLETMDWSLLEGGVKEHKFYCPGTGLVLETEASAGQTRNELVAITR